MSVENRWHFDNEYDAAQAGVTERCEHSTTRRPLWPKQDHGRGREYRVRVRMNGKELPVRSFKNKTGLDGADAYDAELTAKKNQGITPFDVKKGNVSFVEYGRGVVRKRYQSNARSLEAQLSRFNNHIATYPLFEQARMMDGDIQPSDVAAWLEWLRAKKVRGGGTLHENTVESIWVIFNLIMTTAIEVDGIRQANPLPKLIRPTRERRRVTRGQVWEDEEVDAMIEALPDFHESVGLLAALCGHRAGEAFAVAVEDFAVMTRNIIRRVHPEITIQHQVTFDSDRKLILAPPKWNSVRTVPLDVDVAASLRAHAERYGTTAVRCTCCAGQEWHLLFAPAGQLIHSKKWYDSVWWPAFTQADIAPRGRQGLHGLRHYYGSLLIDGGADPKLVQELMGHRSHAVTMDIYGHLFKRSDEKARTIIRDRTLRARPAPGQAGHG